MTEATDEKILNDLVVVMKEMTDWEYSGPISRETKFFADLGYESVDAVFFGGALEDHYGQRFPFGEFLEKQEELGRTDMSLGELVDFVRGHLDGSSPESLGGLAQ